MGSPMPDRRVDVVSLCDIFACTYNIQRFSVRSLHVEQGFTDPLVDCLRLQST